MLYYFIIIKGVIKHIPLYSQANRAHGAAKFIMDQGTGKKRENKENEEIFAKRDEVKNTQCSLDHEIMKETTWIFFFM